MIGRAVIAPEEHILAILYKDGKALFGLGTQGHRKGKRTGLTGRAGRFRNAGKALIHHCSTRLKITPKKFELAGRKDYHLKNGKVIRVDVFLITEYEGELGEAADFADPKWYAVNDIPYGEMFGENRNFLPGVFLGHKPYHVFASEGPDQNNLWSVNYLA